MDTKIKLITRKTLLLSEHLAELRENFSANTNDWSNLRINHRQEIELMGLLFFRDFNRQIEEVIVLGDFHKARRTSLKVRQNQELDSLDNLIEIESQN